MGRSNVGIFVILRVRFTEFSAFAKMLLSLRIEFYFEIIHYFGSNSLNLKLIKFNDAEKKYKFFIIVEELPIISIPN